MSPHLNSDRDGVNERKGEATKPMSSSLTEGLSSMAMLFLSGTNSRVYKMPSRSSSRTPLRRCSMVNTSSWALAGLGNLHHELLVLTFGLSQKSGMPLGDIPLKKSLKPISQK